MDRNGPQATVHRTGTLSASSSPQNKARNTFRGRAASSSLAESTTMLHKVKGLIQEEKSKQKKAEAPLSFSTKLAQWKAAEAERRILRDTRAYQSRLELQRRDSEKVAKTAAEDKSGQIPSSMCFTD